MEPTELTSNHISPEKFHFSNLYIFSYTYGIIPLSQKSRDELENEYTTPSLPNLSLSTE